MKLAAVTALPLVAALGGCVCFATSDLERETTGVIPPVNSVSEVDARLVKYFNGELAPVPGEFSVAEEIESALPAGSLVLDGGGPRVEVEVIHYQQASVPMGVLAASTLYTLPFYSRGTSEVRTSFVSPATGEVLGTLVEVQSFVTWYGMLTAPLIPFVGTDSKVGDFWRDSAVRSVESTLETAQAPSPH